MRPSVALDAHRDAIRATVARRRLLNPRVFGSVARGEDREGSDLDLLVDTMPETSLFDLIHAELELAELTGVKVDVVTAKGLHRRIKNRVMTECRTI
jgi:uncharacterized protein